MKAFHGDPAIKAKYVARLKAHHEADNIMQRVGWDPEAKHGCAVGCTLESYDHDQYPIELGLPVWLARLEDTIFENLSPIDAQQFAVDFLTVIPVGADVSKVKWQLAKARAEHTLVPLRLNPAEYAIVCVSAIEQCVAYFEAEIANLANPEQRLRAKEAAKSAAESARSAYWSASWSAESASWSAESAARSAYWSLSDSAYSAIDSAYSAADSAEAHWLWERDTLLNLLSAASVPVPMPVEI